MSFVPLTMLLASAFPLVVAAVMAIRLRRQPLPAANTSFWDRMEADVAGGRWSLPGPFRPSPARGDAAELKRERWFRWTVKALLHPLLAFVPFVLGIALNAASMWLNWSQLSEAKREAWQPMFGLFAVLYVLGAFVFFYRWRRLERNIRAYMASKTDAEMAGLLSR